MEERIEELSNQQVRYIYESLLKDFFINIEVRIKVERSVINYDEARLYLWYLTQESKEMEAKVSSLIIKSEEEEKCTTIIAMDPATGLVWATGIILTCLLIWRKMKINRPDEVKRALVKLLEDPPPEVLRLIKKLVQEAQVKPDDHFAKFKEILKTLKLEVKTNNLFISDKNDIHINQDQKKKLKDSDSKFLDSATESPDE